MFDIIQAHLPEVHCFADDTQLFLSFGVYGNISQGGVPRLLCMRLLLLGLIIATAFPDYHINKLQRIQNVAARLICQQSRFCHITPLLFDLYWQ